MKYTLEDLAILRLLAEFPHITQKALSEKTGISMGTIKRRTVEMQEKGLLRRVNGKRNGTWEVLVELA